MGKDAIGPTPQSRRTPGSPFPHPPNPNSRSSPHVPRFCRIHCDEDRSGLEKWHRAAPGQRRGEGPRGGVWMEKQRLPRCGNRFGDPGFLSGSSGGAARGPLGEPHLLLFTVSAAAAPGEISWVPLPCQRNPHFSPSLWATATSSRAPPAGPGCWRAPRRRLLGKPATFFRSLTSIHYRGDPIHSPTPRVF